VHALERRQPNLGHGRRSSVVDVELHDLISGHGASVSHLDRHADVVACTELRVIRLQVRVRERRV